MEAIKTRSSIFAAGLAIFAMFFGAGNIVFPLIVGQFSLNQNIFGILGMSITAVLVPLIGLLGIILYEGDYMAFFQRIGKKSGFLMVALILCLIGPLGAIPRCITVSYSTLVAFGFDKLPYGQLPFFSLISCVLIFLFTIRPAGLIDVLGKFLTPILLLFLGIIIVKGLWTMPAMEISPNTPLQTFCRGFLDGYHTMDLLASFFFSSVVLLCLRQKASTISAARLFPIAVGGAVVAATLLLVMYMCFSTLAAGHSHLFENVPPHQLLGAMSKAILGQSAGLIASSTVFFAVFTTEIALATVFAKFLQEHLLRGKISYSLALLVTLVVSFGVSTLHFDGIVRFIGPILQLCYPALIALSVANIVAKLYGRDYAKPLFYGTLAVTACMMYLSA